MKVTFLLNKVRTGTDEEQKISQGKLHDSHLFGMLRLRKRGIETTYLEPEQWYPAWFMRLVRHRILSIFWVHILIFPRLFRYDIIFSSTAYGSLLVWSLYPFKKPKWVILDFNILGTMQDEKTVRQKIFAFAVSKSSGIVTISEKEKHDLEKRFPHMVGSIEFIHEGTDTQFFKPAPIEPNPASLLSVGRDPSRDFRTLVDAVKDSPYKLTIATKPERATELAPLPSHITVAQFSHEEMQQEFAKALLVVVPLKVKPGQPNDSMGTFSVIEAMAMGKVVIATKTQSMESYITHGVNGFLVEPYNTNELRRIIDEVVHDPHKRKEIERNAREFAVKYCDAEVFAEKLSAFFKRLLA